MKTADKTLIDMFCELKQAPKIVHPSKCWEDLNQQHMQILDLDNFKRTLGHHYFTFFCARNDPQLKFLHKQLSKSTRLKNRLKTKLSLPFPQLTKERSHNYIYLTLLLWDYLSRQLPKGALNLEEPLLGQPFIVKWRGQKVSQDLANSLLEFHTIMQDPEGINTVLELGAGYGRVAYVFLKKMPNVKYIVCDIPPALFIAQSYLSSIFSDKKIFTFRPFRSFTEVEKEFSEAQICFLLPHQLELLPSHSIDLGLNISSLHEMYHEQIAYYFSQFSRLLSKRFYFKQWQVSYVPHDDITLKESDYPIPSHWHQIFWRTCPVQTKFFEALFEVGCSSSKANCFQAAASGWTW